VTRRHRDEGWVSGHDWGQAWAHLPHGVILGVVLLAIAVAGLFGIRKVLLPAEEQLRRDVYEESKSYRDGTIRDLDNLRLEWLKAEGVHKAALAETARHRAADFPRDELPERLRGWLVEIEP
jgi:hypothetical protein